jgi:DNA recombination protein RmuC
MGQDELYMLIALLIGIVLGYLLHKALQPTVNQSNMIPKALFDRIESDADVLKADLQEQLKANSETSQQLAATRQTNSHLQEQLAHQNHEYESLNKRFETQFEIVANRLLQTSGDQMVMQNRNQLDSILAPLKDRIQHFEGQLQQQASTATAERATLQQEIRQLRDLNQQLSREANQLVAALRSDNKSQGNWGEVLLERLLEKSGLVPQVHFKTQQTLRNEVGDMQRPDVIVYLPGGKHLIIDAKVSLVGYQQFHAADNDETQMSGLQTHLRSLRNHIKELSSKEYHRLADLNSPDYILLFVPIEPALTLAMQQDEQLFEDALEKKIVLVSAGTLLATMRTVSYMWQQDKQRTNAFEIARQAGLLYDKFVAFTDDMKLIGSRLDQASLSYRDAMNKLSDSTRPGTSLVGRAEKLRTLGAKNNKALAAEFLVEEDEV